MVALLEKTQSGYTTSLTAEMVEELKLHDGSVVQVLPVEDASGGRPEIRSASAEEVLAAFERTLPLHEETYRELAK